MTKPMIRIHNIDNDEIIDREMTDTEFKAYQAEQAKDLALANAQAKAEADKIAAQAKLEALGLTADDLKALGL